MKFIKYSLMVLCIALTTSYVNAQIVTDNDENVTHTYQEDESQKYRHQQEEHNFSGDAALVQEKDNDEQATRSHGWDNAQKHEHQDNKNDNCKHTDHKK